MSRPSRRTHGYYRAVVVKGIRKYCGYSSDAEAHRAIKSSHFEMHPDDPNLPSMALLSQEDAALLIDHAIQKAAELGIYLPDPREAAV